MRLSKNQENEEDKQNSSQNTSQIVQLTKEDRTRLKGQGNRNSKIVRRSHQWSFDDFSDECEPPKGKGQATFSRDRKFTLLEKSKAEVLHLLISRGKITKLLPPVDHKSKRYDPTQRGLYHSNSLGHDTEECWALWHKVQNLIESGGLKLANDIEITTMGKGDIKKSRAYPPEREMRDEVMIMFTHLHETRSEPLMTQGMAKEIRGVLIETATSKPQYPAVNLKVIPWKYEKGSKGASEWGAVLPKNNTLCLPERAIETLKVPSDKVPKEKVVEFPKRMGHNEAARK